jgi:hypothetical protein
MSDNKQPTDNTHDVAGNKYGGLTCEHKFIPVTFQTAIQQRVKIFCEKCGHVADNGWGRSQ